MISLLLACKSLEQTVELLTVCYAMRQILRHCIDYYRLSIYRGHIQHGSAHSPTVAVSKLQTLHSRTTPHTSPLRASYGCLSWVIEKKHRDISRSHCIAISFSPSRWCSHRCSHNWWVRPRVAGGSGDTRQMPLPHRLRTTPKASSEKHQRIKYWMPSAENFCKKITPVNGYCNDSEEVTVHHWNIIIMKISTLLSKVSFGRRKTLIRAW